MLRTVLSSIVPVLLATGCMPFASPPLRVGFSGGGSFGEVIWAQDDQARSTDRDSMFAVRAELMPLDAVPWLLVRDWDLGLGYQAEFLQAAHPARSVKHGPFLSATWYPVVVDDSEAGPEAEAEELFLWRLGLGLRAGLLLADGGPAPCMGGGGAFTVSFEFTSFAAGEFGNSDLFGLAYGEAGVGLFAEAGWRHIHGGSYSTFVAGLQFRLPASVGLMAVW